MYISPIGVSTIFTTLREGSHDGFVKPILAHLQSVAYLRDKRIIACEDRLIVIPIHEIQHTK